MECAPMTVTELPYTPSAGIVSECPGLATGDTQFMEQSLSDTVEMPALPDHPEWTALADLEVIDQRDIPTLRFDDLPEGTIQEMIAALAVWKHGTELEPRGALRHVPQVEGMEFSTIVQMSYNVIERMPPKPLRRRYAEF